MAASNNPSTRGIIAGIRDAIQGAIDFGIDSSRKKSDLWRLFYDSELGSNLEKSTQKAVAVSVYKSLIHYFPSLKENNNTVIAVSRTFLLLLDRSKLMYQYRKGRITVTQMYEELGKRYATTLLTAIRRGEDMVTATLSSILKEQGIPVDVTRGTLRSFFDKIEPSEDQCIRLVAEGLRRMDQLVNEADVKITKALEPVRDFIKEKVIPWMEKTKESIKEGVKRIIKKL